MTVPALEIGNSALLVPVEEGVVVVRSYTQSMYDVPVHEKFRVEQGYMRLFHVMTRSPAVLAYLGLESGEENNVDLKFREFTIPAASTGDHVLSVAGKKIGLAQYDDGQGRIRVKLVRVPLLVYVSSLCRR